MNFISSIMPREIRIQLLFVLICTIYGSILRDNLPVRESAGGTCYRFFRELLYNNHAEQISRSSAQQVVTSSSPILRILQVWVIAFPANCVHVPVVAPEHWHLLFAFRDMYPIPLYLTFGAIYFDIICFAYCRRMSFKISKFAFLVP